MDKEASRAGRYGRPGSGPDYLQGIADARAAAKTKKFWSEPIVRVPPPIIQNQVYRKIEHEQFLPQLRAPVV
jgi:hypothetical protein